MANDTIDLLQIKVEKAKRELPLDTVNAIDSVDWKAVILGMRTKSGYTFEQLGNLEIETELVLCGLLSPADYPKELEKRMQIPKAQANELVNEMNDSVFKKIREELVKNAERKRIFASKIQKNSPLEEYPAGGGGQIYPPRSDVHRSTPQEGNKLPIPEKLELETHPIVAQKLAGSFQTEKVETDHSLGNLSSSNTISVPIKPKIDPYREIPE